MTLKNLLIVSFACIPTAFLLGCGQKSASPESRPPHDGSRQTPPIIRSTADLRRLLVPAMGTNEILGVLGKPSWKEDLSKGAEVWHYNLPTFPADDEMRGSLVAGVSLGVTNGHLAKWGCSYVGSTNNVISQIQIIKGGNTDQAVAPILRFFLVRNDPIADGRFIDTPHLPKLGFIGQTPILTISGLKQVTLEERGSSQSLSRTNWAFSILLTGEDGEKLKTITAANISRKLLIMVGDEPIAAPLIVATLGTGSFLIECQDRSMMESVKRQLAGMVEQ